MGPSFMSMAYGGVVHSNELRRSPAFLVPLLLRSLSPQGLTHVTNHCRLSGVLLGPFLPGSSSRAQRVMGPVATYLYI